MNGKYFWIASFRNEGRHSIASSPKGSNLAGSVIELKILLSVAFATRVTRRFNVNHDKYSLTNLSLDASLLLIIFL